MSDDKLQPVNVLVTGGDRISRTAVSKVIETSLKEQHFSDVNLNCPSATGMTMLDALGQLYPAHRMVPVNITPLGTDDLGIDGVLGKIMIPFFEAEETEAQKQERALANPNASWNTKTPALEKLLGEVMHQEYIDKGPELILDEANKFLAKAGIEDRLVSAQFNNGVVVGEPMDLADARNKEMIESVRVILLETQPGEERANAILKVFNKD